jgi:polyisoprenyl-teichoic acid--peptidoglycan teichoic acid transferase
MKRKEKKGSTKFKTTLKVLLILTTSVLICAATYGIYLTKKAENAANRAYEELGSREQSAKRDEKVEPVKDNVSILFIGIDDSETREQGADNARSDALILATMNVKTKTVKTLSIPRDSYVYIPSKKRDDKITHAHAHGGTISTIDTIENLLDIPVDYYVRMNFNAFIDIVDALGGIEVEVPYSITELNEKDERVVQLEKGLQKLNGSESLALARTRKKDSDIERGKRQQEILKAIATQAAKPSSILKYDELIDAVADNTKTNMTFGEMKSFLTYLSSGMPRIDSLYLAGEDDWSTGVYYYMLDDESLEETIFTLKNHLGLEKNVNMSQQESENDTDESKSIGDFSSR